MDASRVVVAGVWGVAVLGLLTGRVLLDTPEKVQAWQALNLLLTSALVGG